MVTFNGLHVVVVPFPFADQAAVVVSTPWFKETHQSVVLAMVTSTPDGWRSDVPIQDWPQAGLPARCYVRFKLFTLDDGLIARRAGALSKRDTAAVQEALGQLLSVSDGG